MTNTHFIHI